MESYSLSQVILRCSWFRGNLVRGKGTHPFARLPKIVSDPPIAEEMARLAVELDVINCSAALSACEKAKDRLGPWVKSPNLGSPRFCWGIPPWFGCFKGKLEGKPPYWWVS